MKSAQRFLTLITTLSLAMVFVLAIGCSGDDGPPGVDGTIPDNVPPTISMTSPVAGDTLHDTLRVVALAEDNAGIEKVVFYFDGSDARNDTGYVHLYEPPYEYTWDLIGMGVEDGPHTVMGRAYDLAGNVTNTPPVIVYSERIITAGRTSLYHYNELDSLHVLPFPERIEDETTITVDSLWTRFTVERSCTVDSVYIYLDSLETVAINYDTLLLVSIYASNGVYPTEEVATSAFDARELSSVGFKGVAGFTPAPTFAAGEKFHVLITPDSPTDTTLFAIRSSVIERYPFATDSRSGAWVDDQLRPAHWETAQEIQSNSYTKEYWIRAVVTYE